MSDKAAVCVLSGGQDSTTCLGWALARYEYVYCITFDYGQRHAREIEAARAVRDHFERCYGKQIHHEVLAFPERTLLGTSPLTNQNQPLETYNDHASMAEIIGDRVEKTFVPMRNTLFLTVAANRAVVLGINTLITGVCQEDNANYPDCREEYVWSLAETFDRSLRNPDPTQSAVLRIETPLMHLSKAQTVRLALDTPHTYGALSFSHTAYDGQYPPVGRDHASLLRAQGFLEADRPDPLVLRAVHEGLMPMPDTPNYATAAAFTDALLKDWER